MWSRQNNDLITTRTLSSVKLTARMRSMTAPALLSSEGRSFAAELMSRSRLTQVAEWRTASNMCMEHRLLGAVATYAPSAV